MNFHFANAWEAIAQRYGDRPALRCGAVERSWEAYERRSAQLATVLAGHGLQRGFKAALYLHNCNEYLEAQFAVFKLGGCPVNVNYRYKADELAYVLDNADCEVLFFHATYAARVWELRHRLPKVRLLVQVDDGTEPLLDGAVDFESTVTRASPLEPRPQNPDDVYMLYTGGTTGMPKGVMYRMGDFCGQMIARGAIAQGLPAPQDEAGLLAYVAASRPQRALPACPLMHGTGMWVGAMIPLLSGGSVNTLRRPGLDPDEIWGLVEAAAITDLVIVGDAFARPLLAALEAAQDRGHAYDISSLRRMSSSGVMWSLETKRALLAHHAMELFDVMGSTEGRMATALLTREVLERGPAETGQFTPLAGVQVFRDDGEPVVPGSGEVGRLATSGLVPIGYYKDPEKTAATFQEVGGVRYSFPGDHARVEADGQITLLGRGSGCINTGGEKVFPEEVEEVLKRHPAVNDCLVVGVEDMRFGERVVAVVALGAAAEEEELVAFAREQLAGYKLPRQVLPVPEVRRGANGKANYQWARLFAREATGNQAG